MSKHAENSSLNGQFTSSGMVCLAGALLPGLYLLTTSTMSLIPGIWPYDAKRILQFLLLLLLFSLPFLNQRIRIELSAVVAMMPRWLVIALLSIFAWGSISVWINARSPLHLANSFSEVALLLAMLLAVLVIAACRRAGQRRFDQIAIGLIVLTSLAVGVQELVGVLAAHASGVEFNFRISLLHFSWPRFYNQIQSWVIPVIAALPLLFNRHRLAVTACIVALGLHWYIIFMTGGRGSFVSLGMAFLVGMVFLPAVRRQLLTWQSLGIALGAVLYVLVLLSFESADTPGQQALIESPPAETEQVEPGQDKEEQSSYFLQSLGRPMMNTSGRFGMWRQTLRDAANNPVFGIGPMNYVCTSPIYMGHPHNFVLQIAAEWGIAVAVAITSLFLVLMFSSLRQARRTSCDEDGNNTLRGLLLIGILAAALHACLSGVLVMPASQVTGMLICGLLIGLNSERQTKKSPVGAGLTSTLGISLSLGLIMLGLVELRTMEERSVHMRPGEDLRPRIWQDAKVCRLYVTEKKVIK